MKIPIEVSARHVHISEKELGALFGPGHQLKKIGELTQSNDFRAEEVLSISHGDKIIENVRIVGPEREKTQVEISKTDAIYLKINPPIRLSGDLEGTPGITLIGPKGKIKINEGVIISSRHIHCNSAEAKKLKIKNCDNLSISVSGDRGLVFHNVKIRVKEVYRLAMHIDTDEGNAAGINKAGQGIIIKIK